MDLMKKSWMLPVILLFATSSNDIGMMTLGVHPQRKYNMMQGLFSKKGWLKDNQWLGIIPVEELPRVLNPEKGYIVNSNNAITSSNVKYGVGLSYTHTHRAIRITELIEQALKEQGVISIDKLKEIQKDTVDIQVRESLPTMCSLVAAHSEKQVKVLFKTEEEQ